MLVVPLTNSFAVVFVDDFQSYNGPVNERGEFLNGLGNWSSNDTYYDQGWLVTADGASKYARFWPSPWTGGYGFSSNYLTYHANVGEQVDSLVLDMDYFMQTRGDVQVYISGDNVSWTNITDSFGLLHYDRFEIENSRVDVSSLIASNSITNDVYVRYSVAAYDPDFWVFGLDKFQLEVNEGTPASPVPEPATLLLLGLGMAGLGVVKRKI